MKMKTNKIQQIKTTGLYLLTMVFWGIFYYFLPLAGDDWAWGSSLGINRLRNAFDGYNGRYLGNILIILITRSVIAKIILCTLIMFLLILILSKIFDSLSSDDSSTANYIIAFSSVLLLVLPNQIAFGDIQPFQIFGSTIGWLSGFTNYVVPSVLILIFYYIVTNKKVANLPIYIFLLIDGILACLCVEHYTLFCLLFSFAVMGYRYYFDRRLCKKSLSFFIGSLIGAIIMFTNSSYTLMQKGNAENKQRAVGFLGSFKQYASYIFPKNTSTATVIIFEAVLLLAVVSFVVFFFLKMYKNIKGRNVSKLLPIICLTAMTLPLLFTNSGKEIYIIAPRCYFLQYFMLVIYIYGRLADKQKMKETANKKRLYVGIKLSFTILIWITTVVYCRLDYMGFVRESTVKEALEKGNSTVEIVEYPDSIEHIQWASNFIEKETYLKRYINFKRIPENKDVVIIKSS